MNVSDVLTMPADARLDQGSFVGESLFVPWKLIHSTTPSVEELYVSPTWSIPSPGNTRCRDAPRIRSTGPIATTVAFRHRLYFCRSRALVIQFSLSSGIDRIYVDNNSDGFSARQLIQVHDGAPAIGTCTNTIPVRAIDSAIVFVTTF